MMNATRLVATALLMCYPVSHACAQVLESAPVQGYYRFPALTDDSVIFAAEGDLWKVSLSGGVATRLTSHPGTESNAVVSPDGKMVAFAAQYEGPVEVYTMPVSGGLPTRRTWFGGRSAPVGFAAAQGAEAAKLLVATRRYSTLPNMQLVSIGLDSKSPTITRIPLDQAADGDFDSAGNLYFTRQDFQGSYTRRYMGGTAEQLWKLDAAGFSKPEIEAIPLTATYDGTSATPMFFDGRIYFRSDRATASASEKSGSVMNIWSMKPDGSDLKQHTFHDDFEVRTPRMRVSKDAGGAATARIAYQHGADIFVLDVGTGKTGAVPITLSTDLDQTREKWISKPFEYLTSAHISPDGDRVAITARGQVFVAPKKYGRLVEVTRSATARARDARFMPDGKSVLMLSDQSGEVELWKAPANGLGNIQQLTGDADVLRWEAVPAPDGKHIAHHDKNQRLWVYDVEKKTSTKIDENRVDNFAELRWSKDGRWLAYAAYSSNLNVQLKLYDSKDGAVTFLTSDRTNSSAPTWSADGTLLYFLSDRNLESVVESPWGPAQPEPFFDKKSRIYALALKPGAKWPFVEPNELLAAKKDDETKDDDKTEEKKDQAKEKKPAEKSDGMDSGRSDDKGAAAKGDEKGKEPEKKKEEKVKPVEIDTNGLMDRVYPTPFPPGNYSGLLANDKALFMLSAEADPDAKPSVVAFSLEEGTLKKREWKMETVAGNVKAFELSADGKSLLIQTENSLHIVDAGAAKVDDMGKAAVDLSGWQFSLRPRDEWRQMYNEAWRLHRDYFYDRAMHGVNWNAAKSKYAPLVDRVASRTDLSDILAQMIAELSALHHFVVGGDARTGKENVQTAFLGGLLTRDDAAGGWKIDTIWQTDPDQPDDYSPLAAPGVDIQTGDVVTKINGVPTLSVADPAELMRGRAGKQVLLHYKRTGDKPDAEERQTVVKPVDPGEETNERLRHWRVQRREMVEEWGKGDIGYVHLRAMGKGDIADFTRQYYPVFTRKGLIIDVRHNGGGNIDSWVLSRLMRKAWFFWQGRIGDPTWNMQFAFRGHMCVLCDEHTGSDGEAFSEGFRRLGLGKVIGTRTWGGEIWLSFSNYLVDKGIASAAEIGVYGPEGTWLIEGRGVEPDITIDNPPHGTFLGKDDQLEAAVNHLMRQIKEKPVEIPPAPKRPDKSWKPVKQ